MADRRPAEARAALSRRLVLLIFLLSGAAGLIYEVVWSRQLVLVFGNTTQAISAILTGFFGGMAIGSVVGGRIADRMRRPLRMYAALELLVVIAVLITPLTFRGLHEVYRGAFGTLEQNPELLALVRFGLSVLALGPATVLMGATLPTLSRHLVRDHTALGHEFGTLYTVNTLGAIVGAGSAGIVLIELFGLSVTLLVGVLCSGAAGLAALLLSSSLERGAETAREPAASRPAASRLSDGPGAAVRTGAADRPASTARPRLALALAFVSGLTSLGYQNLWTRLLSSGTGSSSYIFTSILVLFLVGITIGAFIFTRFLSRTKRPILILGLAELALAVIVLGTLAVSTKWLVRASFPLELLIVVAPATLVLGLVFPLSSVLVADSDDRIGTSAGMLLGANTLGSIIGTFVVPFYLIPLLTSPRAVVLLAAINALIGVALIWEAREVPVPWRRLGSAASGAVAVAAVALLIVPNHVVADPEVNVLRRLRATIYSSAEDEVSTVQAARFPKQRFDLRLYVGGYTMTGMNAITRLMPILPQMARPEAKSICVVAFGMGSSYRSALIAGLETDAVELVPSVPEQMKYYFPDADQYLNDPRGRVLIADGRNHVELTDRSYDIVIVDPPPPMNTSGTAVLFSREFYVASKARLGPSGVMLQWVPFGINVDEFRSHAKTFKSVFKHVTIVFSPSDPVNGVAMLGSDEPIEFTSANVQAVLSKPGVLEDIGGAVDSPAGVQTAAQWEQTIRDHIWISDGAVDRFGASGQLVTDDRPYTEYDLIRHTFGPQSPVTSRESLLAATP